MFSQVKEISFPNSRDPKTDVEGLKLRVIPETKLIWFLDIKVNIKSELDSKSI